MFPYITSFFSQNNESKKFLRLATIFSFTIGVYWILNPTKDVVFLHMVGLNYYAYAKILSIAVLIPLILLYSRLIDLYERHRLFYAICALYALGALVFGVLFLHPTIGMANAIADKWRLTGWLWYAFIESFGSLIVSLFWSFASDISTPEEAKKGFSTIALGAQIGGVLGPLLFRNVARVWGAAPFAFIGAIGIAVIGLLIYWFMTVTPNEELAGFDDKKHELSSKAELKKDAKRTGFFEGLSLITSHGYLLGIFGIVALSEIVFVVTELHLKTLAKLHYTNPFDLNGFFFTYALCVNSIALISLLLGVGSIGRKLGLVRSLVLFPCLIACGVIALGFHYTLATSLVVFVLFKGIHYSFNNPIKEQLYIPTSRESKYKSKAWIDMFGARLSKSIGSSIHILRPMLQLDFVRVSLIICSGLVAVWVGIAFIVGNLYAQAVQQDKKLC